MKLHGYHYRALLRKYRAKKVESEMQRLLCAFLLGRLSK